MPTSLSSPSLFSVTRSLLALRRRITWKTIERSPAAQTASILALVLVCPAALQIGSRAAGLLKTAPAEAFPAVCSALLLLTLLYIALLLAGNAGVGGVMEPPPATVLRALPVPRGAILLADAFSFVVSLPTLFFAIAMIPMGAGWRSVVPLALLGMFAIAFALLLGRLGMLVAKRGRNGLILATCAVLLLGGLVLRAAPAAALSSVIEDKKPSVRLPWDPPAPPPPTIPVVLQSTPPGLAAQCLTGTSTAILLLALATTVGLTATATILLDRANDRIEPASDAKPNRVRTMPRHADSFVTEARLLLRNPSAHMMLRGPASLLLTIGYAWIAPNLGPDAVRNLADLLGMGVTMYLAVWQTQFLCNRFGSEAGSTATLFSLPRERWRVLLTKNVTLLALLFLLDGTVLAGFAFVAGSPRLISTLLLGLIPVLTIFTALGNVVSVLLPFPLPRKTERFEREPERSLMFVYGLVGVGTWLLFSPVLLLGQKWGIVGYAVGGIYVLALYTASVWIAARLLSPLREQRLITLLDGVK